VFPATAACQPNTQVLHKHTIGSRLPGTTLLISQQRADANPRPI